MDKPYTSPRMAASAPEGEHAAAWDTEALLDYDRRHVWHPYSSICSPPPAYPVVAARGVFLELAQGDRLVDGMSSWWAAIHGYNHPRLNQALRRQLDAVAHVMFGGLTHPPAVELCRQLVELSAPTLQKVFLSDSGSVAVEVACKMALQYWQAAGCRGKTRFLALRGGYHGDTFTAMSLCDPVTGMHHLFQDFLPRQLFAPRPTPPFGAPCGEEDVAPLKTLLERHAEELAAVVLEPVVQGAGGMHFYSADYLRHARALCDANGVLLICDEIATGFGRTGRLFACEHADIAPDILCLGKAMTGGYLSLAATLCSTAVAEQLCQQGGALLQGPTFMGNPLACAVASASIGLLLEGDWQARVARIEEQLRAELASAAQSPNVADVRVLGAIGVIETHQAIDLAAAQRYLVRRGVWLRPFGKLLYTMPPYVITEEELRRVTGAMTSWALESSAPSPREATPGNPS